jgi:hypothetical protein
MVTEGYFVRTWGGAFGGVKWGQCAWTLFELDNSIQQVLRASATPSDIYRLLNAVNTSVHQAHNGGFWLGKFGALIHDANSAGAGGWLGLIHAMPAIYRIAMQRSATKEAAAHAAKAWSCLAKLRRPQFELAEGKLTIKKPVRAITYKVAGWHAVKTTAVSKVLDLPEGIYPIVAKRIRKPGIVQLRLFAKVAPDKLVATGKCITYKVVRPEGSVAGLNAKPIITAKENNG